MFAALNARPLNSGDILLRYNQRQSEWQATLKNKRKDLRLIPFSVQYIKSFEPTAR